MKRALDLTASFLGLLLTSPIFLVVILLVWLQDYKTPFYIAPRVGKDEKLFNMVKLRSMIINLENSGPDSTSLNDSRITPVGYFIRKFKLDELSQLWNVLIGEMSLVGPRPNVKNETDLYTDIEKELLTVKPGITDFSSIVFSDEQEILEDEKDPDLAYNQLIRPWKSRLGIIYIRNQSFRLDLELIFLTFLGILSKKNALARIQKRLKNFSVDQETLEICKREKKLYPHPPPGSERIVLER